MNRTRLLVVDDEARVRRGLRMRLTVEADMEVIGEAGSGEAALQLVRSLSPDVVLMDVEMPGAEGISGIAALRRVAPRSAVVVFTLYDDAAMRARAREAGAAAFVTKHQTEEALLTAIRRAALGHGKQA